jgi:SAM-dependent methyltransferase
MEQNTEDVSASYDRVADEYVSRIYDELDHKPQDRELLDRFAREMHGLGRVYDLGCGPGHVTRCLSEYGADITGIDLSPQMIEQARKLNPGIPFQTGNMARLDLQDESAAGIVAFYSIIHFPREQVVTVLQEFRRVLKPNGLLFLAFHLGQEVRHFDEWWGQQVRLDFNFFTREEMKQYLKQAGFVIDECIERDPIPEFEAATRRAYIFARKPNSQELMMRAE